jgi:predicted transposase YdaD
VPKNWDILIKMLMQANPQDLVSWILPDATFKGVLDGELQVDSVFADVLYTIEWKGQQIVLHVEFQRNSHPEMDRRLWEYNALASIRTGLPVYSVVVYLVKDSSIVDPPYEMKLSTGFTIHCFFFQNIKLWEIPPEAFKEQALSGLLPLLPLTKEGKHREVVEEMIHRLQEADKADLLPLGYAFSALVFKQEDEQQWLKERFRSMQEILEESWAYQEMVEKGLAQGLEKGLEEGKKSLGEVLVRFVEIHFPDLVLLANQQAEKATTSQQLQEMIDGLFVAHTYNEARATLLGKQE